MNNTEAREMMDKALDHLVQQLDAGRSDAMARYLMAMTRFRNYSWSNTLLIHVQRPDATRVAGFNAWRKMGRWVKKGERGIMILAPCSSRRVVTEDEDDETAAIQSTARYFRPVFVFDVEQTDGAELPQPPRVEGEAGRHIERLERFAREELGIAVEYADHLGGAHGVSTGGMVQVLRHLEAAQRFAVLCHEVAHEMLHWAAPAEIRKDKTLVETQAEAVAFVVTHTLGLETGTAAADYIGLYKGSKETLRLSIDAIHHAAGRLLEALAGTPDRTAAADLVAA